MWNITLFVSAPQHVDLWFKKKLKKNKNINMQ